MPCGTRFCWCWDYVSYIPLFFPFFVLSSYYPHCLPNLLPLLTTLLPTHTPPPPPTCLPSTRRPFACIACPAFYLFWVRFSLPTLCLTTTFYRFVIALWVILRIIGPSFLCLHAYLFILCVVRCAPLTFVVTLVVVLYTVVYCFAFAFYHTFYITTYLVICWVYCRVITQFLHLFTLLLPCYFLQHYHYLPTTPTGTCVHTVIPHPCLPCPLLYLFYYYLLFIPILPSPYICNYIVTYLCALFIFGIFALALALLYLPSHYCFHLPFPPLGQFCVLHLLFYLYFSPQFIAICYYGLFGPLYSSPAAILLPLPVL